MNIDMTVNDRFQDAHCFYGSLEKKIKKVEHLYFKGTSETLSFHMFDSPPPCPYKRWDFNENLKLFLTHNLKIVFSLSH